MKPKTKEEFKRWQKQESTKQAMITEAWIKASVVHVEIKDSEDTRGAGSDGNNGR